MIIARYPWVLHAVNIKVEHHFIFFLVIVARYPSSILGKKIWPPNFTEMERFAITQKKGLPNVASIVKKTAKKFNFEKL